MTAAAATPVHQRQLSYLRTITFKAARQTYDYLVTHQASVSPKGDQAQPPATLLTERDSKGPIEYVVIYTNDVASSYQPVFMNTTGDGDSWKKASATYGTATYPAENGATVSLSTVELSTTSTDGQTIAQATIFTDYDVTADDTDDSEPAVEDNPNTPENEAKPAIPNGTGDDTDYMAAGVWLSGPFSQANSGSAAYAGAFAMGKVPYTGLATGHNALTSVSYRGFAGGKRFSGGTVADFTTTVSLIANFSSTATISGTVADVGGGQKLSLASASIARTSDGGPFSGNTQVMDGANAVSGFTGKWGGAFYGNTAAAKGPRGTAGTFGASMTGDTILGAFIAHRQ